MDHVDEGDLYDLGLMELQGRTFYNITRFKDALEQHTDLESGQIKQLIDLAKYERFYIDPDLLNGMIDTGMLDPQQKAAISSLQARSFYHRWAILEALERASPAWRMKPDTPQNNDYNRLLEKQRNTLLELFRLEHP